MRPQHQPIPGYRVHLRLSLTGEVRTVGLFLTRDEAEDWLREMDYAPGDVFDRISIHEATFAADALGDHDYDPEQVHSYPYDRR